MPAARIRNPYWLGVLVTALMFLGIPAGLYVFQSSLPSIPEEGDWTGVNCDRSRATAEAIAQAVLSFKARTGEWPNSLAVLDKSIPLPHAGRPEWRFTIVSPSIFTIMFASYLEYGSTEEYPQTGGRLTVNVNGDMSWEWWTGH